MNEELYYTPSIEEFHIGFEYEHLHGDYSRKMVEMKKKWNTMVFDTSKSLSSMTKWILDGTIRVKKLDRADIESFGFKLDILVKNGDTHYVKQGFRIILYGSHGGMTIGKEPGDGPFAVATVLYMGKGLLNKSLLKKELKLIGVPLG